MTFHLNQRVLAGRYGPGTIVGFERFTREGRSAEPATEDDGSNNRVIVQLDTPEAWPCRTLTGPNPYMYRHKLMVEPTLP